MELGVGGEGNSTNSELEGWILLKVPGDGESSCGSQFFLSEECQWSQQEASV